jgi:hypothetical protein
VRGTGMEETPLLTNYVSKTKCVKTILVQ